MLHKNFDNTRVDVKYRDELLYSCVGKNLDPIKMLTLEDDQLIYITPTDHAMLDITLSFCC